MKSARKVSKDKLPRIKCDVCIFAYGCEQSADKVLVVRNLLMLLRRNNRLK